MANEVLYDARDDGVVTITLNRPDSANAWTVALHVALQHAFAEAAADPAVRAVVLTGSGRLFCAGADLEMLESFQGGGEIPPELAQHTFLTPLRFPKPLIGAVNGPAAGLGFATALMCDVRFASPKASFTTTFSRLGLVAENGMSWLLPHIVGRSRALDLLLSSRRVEADEAFRIGLVDRVVDAEELLAAAQAYAADLAAHASPSSLAAIKTQVNRHAFATAEVAEEESRVLVAEALAGSDFTEGLSAFLEKRAAQFPGLGEGSVLPDFGGY